MLTRGKVADETGCNIETVRYYEKIGLLPEPARSSSGYRMYDDRHLQRLHFIRRAKNLGFSIERIRQLLDISDGIGGHTRSDVKSLTQAHLDEISKKITHLKKLKRSLSEIDSHCDGSKNDPANTCPILISLLDDDH